MNINFFLRSIWVEFCWVAAGGFDWGSCSVSVGDDNNPRHCFVGLACLAVSKFSVGVEWLLDGLSEYLQFS